MRHDARSLLERLGRHEFRYQEFEDPFADMELWPIFEAMLRDPDVIGEQAPVLRNADVQIRAAKAAEPAEPAKPTLFARYAEETVPAATEPTPVAPVNIRQYFNRFAEGA